MTRHTPLQEVHRAMGARMDVFAGWDMPIRYTDIPLEHRAVREAAGLFDVSHMGELRIRGEGALAFASFLLTNQIAPPSRHRATYSPMCHANGGTVDDLFVYPLSEQDVLLVVNAGNVEKDEAHVRALLPAGLSLVNESPQWLQLAIQGPAAAGILQSLPEFSLWNPAELPFMGWQTGMLSGFSALLSRSGYSGGDGFELYLHCGGNPAVATSWWNRLLDAGHASGLVPAGLGARDTLRLEGGLPLYGHELTDSLTPVEAGLHRFIKLEKGDFLGREALARQMENGVSHIRVGLEMLERGIPREGCPVHATAETTAEPIGWISSGGVGIWVEKNIAMAYVPPACASLETPLWLDIRGRRIAAKVVALPFYKKPRT